MKVSVVIPTYNRAYVIREALGSALGQTLRPFEIVVVDDGSSDDTREIAEGLGASNIRYIRHHHNRGYSAACNTGISAATGDLVAFLDSDDLWKPDYLERQLDFMSRHPEVDAVFSDTEIHGETVIPSLIGLLSVFPKLLQPHPGPDEYVFTGRQMYMCLLQEVPIKPTAFVVKREMFEREGAFNEAWPSGTDWDLFIRFSRSACFGFINLPLVIQRRTADATHQKFREHDKLFLLNVFVQEKRRLEGDSDATRAVNRGISQHVSNLGFLYRHSGHPGRSIAIYLRGFKETGEPLMLMRAASALMPAKVTSLVKRAARWRKPL